MSRITWSKTSAGFYTGTTADGRLFYVDKIDGVSPALWIATERENLEGRTHELLDELGGRNTLAEAKALVEHELEREAALDALEGPISATVEITPEQADELARTWIVKERGPATHYEIATASISVPIASTFVGIERGTADLIAAAPELLEVAKMVYARWLKSSRTEASAIELAAIRALEIAEGR